MPLVSFLLFFLTCLLDEENEEDEEEKKIDAKSSFSFLVFLFLFISESQPQQNCDLPFSSKTSKTQTHGQQTIQKIKPIQLKLGGSSRMHSWSVAIHAAPAYE